MKAKISRGGGFRGVLNYILDKGEAEIVGGNMSGQTPQELTREFGITKALRPDCKNPVWHCSLSAPRGERLSREKWYELGADFMIEMGMDPANFLYSSGRHSDTDYDHIHIVASRIGLDGQLWHGQNDVFKAIKATQKLEQRHGLTLTPGLDLGVKKERKSLTHGELNMAIRTEVKPPRMVCQEAIDAVLQSEGVMSAPEFIERLEALGVRAVPNIASTGTLNGFSFEAEGVAFTGSKLGDLYKWAKLQQRGIEYVKDRDFAALADTRRRAGERAAAGPDAGRDLGAAGPDRAPGAELGAVAPAGGGPGDRSHAGTGSGVTDVGASESGAASIRPGELGAEAELGAAGPGADQPGNSSNGDQGGEHGSNFAGAGQPGAELENDHGQHAGQQPAPTGPAPGSGQRSQGGGRADAKQQPGAGQPGREGAPESVGDTGPDVGRSDPGGAPRGGWASRFKQASAGKRRDPAAGRPAQPAGAQIDPKRARVAESDRVEAREIDPTPYLESQGFDVTREGRHLSVRLHGDEVYRVTRKDDGHWVTCDLFENGIGDNIALVQELEPGTGFAESVYRLSGAPSVARATRPAPAPVVRQPPKMPAQSAADVRRGREYLHARGISLETIEQAEKAGMLRYSARGVLFVGRDEEGTAQNIMRRAVDASELVQKRDLAGTDKRHPQMLLGASETVLIVEGGVDALAAVDIARRERRPVPTVLVSGGANVKGFMQTPWVQKVLKLAKKVIVAFEREATPEAQAKTDQAHELQMQRLREVCGAQVAGWKPPEGIKDMGDLNLHQLQEIEREAAQAPQRAWAEEDNPQQEWSYPTP